MALEVIYGPVDVTYNGAQMSTVSGGLAATYIQGLGLLTVAVSASPGLVRGMYAVQMDGTAYPRSTYQASAASLVPDLRRARGLVVEINTDRFQLFDWLAAQPEELRFLVPPSGFFGAVHAVCADRFLQFSGTHVNSSDLHDAQTFTAEYTWSGTNPGAVASVSVAGPTELCVAFGTGVAPQIRFYDVVQKTQSRPTLWVAETHAGVWYVPKYDVFLELKNRQLKILANAIAPATISNPTFAPTPTAGEVSDVKVQVLGAQSEPCVGELINWTITAGGGSLTHSQTATGSDGYAHTGYVAPTTLVGSVTIGADLEF